MTEAHSRRYNVGLTYGVLGADAMVSMQQWVADTIYDLTGTGFGTREAGMGTLPGGSESAGSTGIVFKQIAALGEEKEEEGEVERAIPEPNVLPTIDFYGPLKLPK